MDLFTTDPTALEGSVWADLASDETVLVEVRRGDVEDPLAGVVRITATGERDVDVVVGRGAWQAEAVRRARAVLVSGIQLPIVAPADLIRLKLYAGGSQDSWDIEQLLAASADRGALIQEVEFGLDSLPAEARRLWNRILRSAGDG